MERVTVLESELREARKELRAARDWNREMMLEFERIKVAVDQQTLKKMKADDLKKENVHRKNLPGLFSALNLSKK